MANNLPNSNGSANKQQSGGGSGQQQSSQSSQVQKKVQDSVAKIHDKK